MAAHHTHHPDAHRCPDCIERAVAAVRTRLESVYAEGSDPDAITVLFNFGDHESHDMLVVPLFWECVAAGGNSSVRDLRGDTCDQDCAAEVLERRR